MMESDCEWGLANFQKSSNLVKNAHMESSWDLPKSKLLTVMIKAMIWEWGP